MLADRHIRESVYSGRIGIDPFFPEQLQPASYDLLLSEMYRRPIDTQIPLDCREIRSGHTILLRATVEHGILLKPGEFILASTVERIRVPPEAAARVEGKSSLGRIGLAVHITAGFIDPGFQGNVTLEVVNQSPWSIRLWPKQRIAQIAFMPMYGVPEVTYEATGHYQDQAGPVESRFKI